MKRGQMKLSFGMIFSIILIIVFIFFAFYGIKKFLDMQNTIQTEQFIEHLQSDIDRAWKGSQQSQEVTYAVPNKIESVCFTDNDFGNLYFITSGYIDRKQIEHIDINKIVIDEDPFCIANKNGQIKMVIKKDYGENLIRIERAD